MRTTMATYTSIFVTWLSLTLRISALEFPISSYFPAARFHHDIFYSGDFYRRPQPLPEFLPFSVNSGVDLKPSLLTFQRAGINRFRTPPAPSVNLFTPNIEQQPAETPGQVENYRKALEEEAREAERQANSITSDRQFGGGNSGRNGGGKSRSYVSVIFRDGNRNYDYRYTL